MDELNLDIKPINLITKYEIQENILVKKETAEEPTTKIKCWNITEEQAQIDKIDAVISLWQDKRKKHQDIIDKYTEMHTLRK